MQNNNKIYKIKHGMTLRSPSGFPPPGQQTLDLPDDAAQTASSDDTSRAATCCFSGHRRLTAADRRLIDERLDDVLYRLIDRGVRTFKAGGALGFDTVAAQRVLEMRERFGDVRLFLELPCRDQCRGWPLEDVVLYKKILGSCDGARYVSDFYYNGCMNERNRRLVDGSGWLVCYLTQNAGGTAATYNHARDRGLRLINLARPGVDFAALSGNKK